jgi:hypothetical protein
MHHVFVHLWALEMLEKFKAHKLISNSNLIKFYLSSNYIKKTPQKYQTFLSLIGHFPLSPLQPNRSSPFFLDLAH